VLPLLPGMDKYHIGALIGQGCFGKVYKGRRRYTGKVVALKFLSKRGKSDKDIKNFRLELGILRGLDHPNIIRLLDSCETVNEFVVVTEFAYGELYEIFQDDKHLPEDQIKIIARQLVGALCYLHGKRIVHRDMKPQNVLVGAGDVVKLCDFGFARAMSKETVFLTSMKGTPLYMSPEQVQDKPYTGSADLWSLGIICYELFTGQPPFYAESFPALFQLIISRSVEYVQDMSHDFKTFLEGLLQKDPGKRLGWPELLDHPFVRARKQRTSSAPPGRARHAAALPRPPSQGSCIGRSGRAEPARPTGADIAVLAVPPAPSQVDLVGKPPHSVGLAALAKWGPLLAEYAMKAPNGTIAEQVPADMPPLDGCFASLCIETFASYADLLERGMLTPSVPQLEHQNLRVSLTGEPSKDPPGVPLATLARALVPILGLTSPPRILLQDLLVVEFGQHQLRILTALSGDRASWWGPAWDLLADLLRLLGQWLRAPLALGTQVAGSGNTLFQADGVLLQVLAIAPHLVMGGITGHFVSLWDGQLSSIHHAGLPLNCIKCLGVAFAHLAQGAAAQPPHPVIESLLQSSGSNVPLKDGRLGNAQLLARALQVLGQCVLLRSVPNSTGDKISRTALQTVSVLLRPTGSALLPEEHLGVRFAQAVALHCFPPEAGGSASVLALIEVVCTGVAEQHLSLVWPSVGHLLGLLITVLQPCGTLPHSALLDARDRQPAKATSMLPAWCCIEVVQALALQMHSALPRMPSGAVLPVLSACYALEFLAVLGGAIIRSFGGEACLPFALRQDLWRSFTQITSIVAELIIGTLVRGRMGRMCLEDMRKAEGSYHGYLSRGPLDGPLTVMLAQHLLAVANSTGGTGIHASQACGITMSLLLVDDPQAVLALLSPRGLLRLVDLIGLVAAAMEPSGAVMRFCLTLLHALQSLETLPVSVLAALPHRGAAFKVVADLIVRIYNPMSQVEPEATELLTDFQSSRVVQTVKHFIDSSPSVDGRRSDTWWSALAAAVQLQSKLVLHDHTLARDFVQQGGLRTIVDQHLLSVDHLTPSMRGANSSESQVVIDALMIVLQLARLSKDYYPALVEHNICAALRDLLAPTLSASLRSKACNTVGNMTRHSGTCYLPLKQAGVIQGLIPMCTDTDASCRKFAAYAIGNSAFHSDMLYADLAPSISLLSELLKDDDEKTRANAAGALGNLVRNSASLCPDIIQCGALRALCHLVDVRRPASPHDRNDVERFTADQSVKIALFSLGNLAVHLDCRAELVDNLQVPQLCARILDFLPPQEETINKCANRLLQKLAT